MDIFERIIEDHDLQRALQQKLLKTEGDSPERQELWQQFRAEYDKHAAAEEEAFYARMLENVETADKARHSVAEHQEELELVRELNETDMSSPGWLANFKKLAEMNDHHMEEEEKEVFPKIKSHFDKAIIDEMLPTFEDRKAREPVGKN